MEFLISDTFTDSLAKLTNVEQAAAKSTAFDLQTNPANPGLQMHRLDKIRDPNFWSARVNQDIRVIVHRANDSLLLCYVDHHDKAYRWAENRKLEVHPATGAAQLVELRETVKEIFVPKYIDVATPPLPIFEGTSDEQLLSYGVPPEWLNEVKAVTSDEALLRLVEHLPSEASDALLILADGGTPERAVEEKTRDPFSHPDALRRFRVLSDVEELRAALEYPWEKWAVFLHPAQRQAVVRTYNGPARVAGTAGTGKTIVAVHRAVHLAREDSAARVLLTTFSSTLANTLRQKVRVLTVGQPRLAERIEVEALGAVIRRLYEIRFRRAQVVSHSELERLIEEAWALTPSPLKLGFLMDEWDQVIDKWQLTTWEDYRDFNRLGRKTRLPERMRANAWAVFAAVRDELTKLRLTTDAEITRMLIEGSGKGNVPYEHVVVDEAQDLSPMQLRFLSAAADKPDALFFAGDSGQRIFQQAFSWAAQGVDIRGRSKNLKINYRTTHQIRSSADKLLAPEVRDVDGNAESREGTVSVFNGPEPEFSVLDSEEEEIKAVADWVTDALRSGAQLHEIGLIVRSRSELNRAEAVARHLRCSYRVLDHNVDPAFGHLSITTMHLAKGLEFKGVCVMACEDEIIPNQERIEAIADQADLEEVYATERHLLYVACTRARDQLLITAVGSASEFLDDLRA